MDGEGLVEPPFLYLTLKLVLHIREHPLQVQVHLIRKHIKSSLFPVLYKLEIIQCSFFLLSLFLRRIFCSQDMALSQREHVEIEFYLLK